MSELETIDSQLYQLIYIKRNDEMLMEIWNSIKNRPELLKEAIEVKRNKWNNSDILKGITISEMVLIYFKEVDPEIYQQLVNTVYSNSDIARIDRDGYFSLLNMTLCNYQLELTEEQKAFAVKETIGNDHRRHSYDIRYQILRNPNWTPEEKQQLVMEFWSDEEYDERLEDWEWNIANDHDNYQGEPLPPFDRYELFNEWDYERLLQHHKNKEITDRIWGEMEFCRRMHQLRPMQWETSKVDIRAQITVTNDEDGKKMADIEKTLERLAKRFGFSVTMETSDKGPDTVVYQKKFPLKENFKDN